MSELDKTIAFTIALLTAFLLVVLTVFGVLDWSWLHV